MPLKNLLPNRQPVAYVFVAVVIYQLFIKGDPLPQEWVQYVLETVGAIIARQVVVPTAKLKDSNAATDVRRSDSEEHPDLSGDGSGVH